jgi:DNA primase
VAAAARDPGLLTRDTFRVFDELSHPGLRVFVSQLATGHTEDAFFEASPGVKAALERAGGELPEARDLLERGFVAACRRLKLRQIDEQLAHIARLAGQLQAPDELSEETRRLQGERVSLLALKRKVLEENEQVA